MKQIDIDVTVSVKPAAAEADFFEMLTLEFGGLEEGEAPAHYLARQAESFLVSRYIGRKTMIMQQAAAAEVATVRNSISLAHPAPTPAASPETVRTALASAGHKKRKKA